MPLRASWQLAMYCCRLCLSVCTVPLSAVAQFGHCLHHHCSTAATMVPPAPHVRRCPPPGGLDLVFGPFLFLVLLVQVTYSLLPLLLPLFLLLFLLLCCFYSLPFSTPLLLESSEAAPASWQPCWHVVRRRLTACSTCRRSVPLPTSQHLCCRTLSQWQCMPLQAVPSP